eukprot:6194128-Pleurochrysis_carterae.AAC.1
MAGMRQMACVQCLCESWLSSLAVACLSCSMKFDDVRNVRMAMSQERHVAASKHVPPRLHAHIVDQFMAGRTNDHMQCASSYSLSPCNEAEEHNVGGIRRNPQLCIHGPDAVGSIETRPTLRVDV